MPRSYPPPAKNVSSSSLKPGEQVVYGAHGMLSGTTERPPRLTSGLRFPFSPFLELVALQNVSRVSPGNYTFRKSPRLCPLDKGQPTPSDGSMQGIKA